MRISIDHVLSRFDLIICTTIETEVRVVAEVREPIRVAGLPAAIELLSISEPSEDGDGRYTWSPDEIAALKKADRNAIDEAVWAAFQMVEQAADIGELLTTHVRLALETGTDAQRIAATLANARKAALAIGSAS